jgi:hypothetical protein
MFEKTIARGFLVAALLAAVSTVARWQVVLTYTTAGAGSVTVPTGCEWIDVTVQCWSGGGGGGVGTGYGGDIGGGGGGGGAYASNTYTTLLSGTYSYYVGAGGVTYSAGGNTIWNYGGIQDIYATGGGGGSGIAAVQV